MRISTVIRLFAAVAVLTALACTLVLAQRFFADPEKQKPATTKLERLIPEASVSNERVAQLVQKLEVENLPDVTPGERAFEAARNLLNVADFQAAEEKLKYVTTYYPTAPSAKEARRILGEMNMDRLFSGDQIKYKVKKGDSFSKIASVNQTNLELIKLLNGLNHLNRLHPGDELNVMPLKLRLVVDVRQNIIELWKEGQFIKGYDTVLMNMPKGKGEIKTIITAIEAKSSGKRTNSSRLSYRESEKVIVVSKPQFEIRAVEGSAADSFEGVVLNSPDIEELVLLLRSKNSVKIRY